MNTDQRKRAHALFQQALDYSPAERTALLDGACDDDVVRAEVEALLQQADGDHPLFDTPVAQVAHDLLDRPTAPDTVGPYHVVRVLGEGGMGTVYLAERHDLGSRAAIKVLRDAHLSPARRARFEREEQILAGLRHPAIAQLYDADVLPDGTPYFVMEYVEGLPLTAYCTAHRCTLAERLRLFRDVCDAVAYAHRQAIIHRDLKPSNIFVEVGQDSAAQVKLLDFGIARPLERLDDEERTRTGLRLMTPAYAAPEQIRGEPVGVYTDVYALGVVLYELLAGVRPYTLTGKSLAEVEALLLGPPPPPPSSHPARLVDPGPRAWADLDVLCLTAMHADVQRRYPTVDALVRDLDHFLDGEPLDARPDSWRYRAGKFARRNRAPLAAALATLGLVVALVVFYTLRLADARDDALAEAEKATVLSEYLIGLFDASDPFAPDSDSLTIDGLLARGVERAEALAGRPTVQAQMLDALGRVHLQLSRYDEADSLLHQALARYGGTHPDVALMRAQTLGNLAAVHAKAGRFDSAEVYVRASLALRRAHLDADDPLLGLTLNDYGVIRNSQGRFDEAQALYREALAIQRNAYPEPHNDLATTLSNLAVSLHYEGDYEGAERYFREAIALTRMLVGPDHVSRASDLANLGVLLQAQGRFEAADTVLTEAVRITRKALGDDHYETAFQLTQLGGVLRDKGDHERAEAILREALAIQQRILDPTHRNTAITLNHLSIVLQDQRRYDEAEPLLARAHTIFVDLFGEAHPLTGMIRCNYANLIGLMGQQAHAETLFRQGLAVLEHTLPPTHDYLAMQRSNFGALRTAQGQFDEAERLLTRSLEVLEQQFSPDHMQVRRTRARLADLYAAWGRPTDAARFRVGDASR